MDYFLDGFSCADSFIVSIAMSCDDPATCTAYNLEVLLVEPIVANIAKND